MKLNIEEASNGWIITSNESRKEPAVFQFDGKNRYRTSLETIVVTATEALQYILCEMLGSQHYKVQVTEEVQDDGKPDTCIQSVDFVPDKTLSS